MFESALIESQKKKSARSRVLILQMAVLLHVVVVGVVLAVQYWTGIPVKLLGRGGEIGDLPGFSPPVFAESLVG